MLMRYINLAIGILFILAGIGLFFNKNAGWDSSVYRTYIDLSNVHKPFGIFLLVLGCYIVVLLGKKNYRPMPENLICPTCEDPFSAKLLKNKECPKCQTQLVNIKGFYNKKKIKDKSSKLKLFFAVYLIFWLSVTLVSKVIFGVASTIAFLILALPLVVILFFVPVGLFKKKK